MARIGWDDLNARQRKLAVRRWHQRQNAQGSSQPAAQSPAQRADRDPLYNPTAPLTGNDLRRAVNEIVNAQYQPGIRALTTQAQTARQQGTALADRVAGYSQQTDERAADAVARQQAIADRLNQQLGQIGTQAQDRVDAAQTGEQQRLAADEQLRGAGLTGGGTDAIAAELAAQRARAASDAQTYRSAGALAGANYAGLANATRGAQQVRGTELQDTLANRLAADLAEIGAKRADLIGQKGGARTKALLDLRQSGFENLVTARGLNIKQSQLQSDIALARRRQRETERQGRNTRADRAADNARADRSLATAESRDAYQRRNRLGPYKPAAGRSPARESADARKLKVGVENATADFRQLLNSQDQNGRARSVQRVQEILRRRGAPPIVILAAGDLAQFGYVRPEHLRSLRIAGVRVPKSWRRPRGAATYSGPT